MSRAEAHIRSLSMSRYVMVIDATKCMNCKACLVACQQRNHVPLGHARNWVRQTPDVSSPLGFAFQPGACMHCDKPLCVDACPTHATYKADDGSVVIDKSRCIGCGSCIIACPYDARYKDTATGTADKCDYCREYSAPGEVPACVRVCPTHCRTFGDADNPEDPVSLLLKENKQVHVVAKNCDTKPSLTYLNHTIPTDWPRDAEIPATVKAMENVAIGTRWLGGLALFGVIGVFLKQLVLPSDREHGPENAHDDNSRNDQGGQA